MMTIFCILLAALLPLAILNMVAGRIDSNGYNSKVSKDRLSENRWVSAYAAVVAIAWILFLGGIWVFMIIHFIRMTFPTGPTVTINLAQEFIPQEMRIFENSVLKLENIPTGAKVELQAVKDSDGNRVMCLFRSNVADGVKKHHWTAVALSTGQERIIVTFVTGRQATIKVIIE